MCVIRLIIKAICCYYRCGNSSFPSPHSSAWWADLFTTCFLWRFWCLWRQHCLQNTQCSWMLMLNTSIFFVNFQWPTQFFCSKITLYQIKELIFLNISMNSYEHFDNLRYNLWNGTLQMEHITLNRTVTHSPCLDRMSFWFCLYSIRLVDIFFLFVLPFQPFTHSFTHSSYHIENNNKNQSTIFNLQYSQFECIL